MSKSKELFAGCDVGYCAIGCSVNESEKDLYLKVDYEYTMSVAKFAKEEGCKQYLLISAMGASTSNIFYLKIKGKVDAEVAHLGFDQCFIYRPGLILRGDRSRVVEKVYGCFIKPVTVFKPEWGQVSVEVLTKSILKKTEFFGTELSDKVTVLENADIHKVSKELTA